MIQSILNAIKNNLVEVTTSNKELVVYQGSVPDKLASNLEKACKELNPSPKPIPLTPLGREGTGDSDSFPNYEPNIEVFQLRIKKKFINILKIYH